MIDSNQKENAIIIINWIAINDFIHNEEEFNIIINSKKRGRMINIIISKILGLPSDGVKGEIRPTP